MTNKKRLLENLEVLAKELRIPEEKILKILSGEDEGTSEEDLLKRLSKKYKEEKNYLREGSFTFKSGLREIGLLAGLPEEMVEKEVLLAEQAGYRAVLEEIRQGKTHQHWDARDFVESLGLSSDEFEMALYLGSEIKFHEYLERIQAGYHYYDDGSLRDDCRSDIWSARDLIEEHGFDEALLYHAIRKLNQINPENTSDYESGRGTPIQKRIEELVTNGMDYDGGIWSNRRYRKCPPDPEDYPEDAEYQKALESMDIHTGKYNESQLLGKVCEGLMKVQALGLGFGEPVINFAVRELIKPLEGNPTGIIKVNVKGEEKYLIIVERIELPLPEENKNN